MKASEVKIGECPIESETEILDAPAVKASIKS
jgi:hypothetical protein